ncbi:MAG: hypothetical protein EBZ67_16235 [Chitinophagia bacterium]|nr:hypothetical protein [Chitinophagia bacterium]
MVSWEIDGLMRLTRRSIKLPSCDVKAYLRMRLNSIEVVTSDGGTWRGPVGHLESHSHHTPKPIMAQNPQALEIPPEQQRARRLLTR